MDNFWMTGALMGDVSGSWYEWHNIKEKPETLILERDRFTDDSVLTYAVAEGILRGLEQVDRDRLAEDLEAQAAVRRSIAGQVRAFARRYPDAGYGGKFRHWAQSDSWEPYGSWGNGSAMRASFAGWVARSLEEAELLGRLSAEVTHNHPSGVKGAEAIAGSIWLLRHGGGKEAVRGYAAARYSMDFTLDAIRPTYSFDSSCEGSVPVAVEAFLEGEDFADVIRLAISVGGDSDTLAAMAASLAEACMEPPQDLRQRALAKLDDFLRGTVERISQPLAPPSYWLRDAKGRTEAEFLASYDPDRYKKPSVAADMVIFSAAVGECLPAVDASAEGGPAEKPAKPETAGGARLYLLLIRRKGHPFLGRWALPGGFVSEGETVGEAASRELEEETHVRQGYLEQLQVFSDWGRDPRMWVMSSAHMALLDGSRITVQAGDDAGDARWFALDWQEGKAVQEPVEGGWRSRRPVKLQLASGDVCLTARLERQVTVAGSSRQEEWKIQEQEGLAFDHAKIIAAARQRLLRQRDAEGIGVLALPEPFDKEQLRRMYEAIEGGPVEETVLEQALERFGEPDPETPGRFRRKMEAFLE